jgi:hypothetical protein
MQNSITGLCWLDWIQESEKKEIIKEYRVAGKYADGYHDGSKTLYEFLGCHFHGCLVCYPNNRDEPKVNNKLHITRYLIKL